LHREPPSFLQNPRVAPYCWPLPHRACMPLVGGTSRTQQHRCSFLQWMQSPKRATGKLFTQVIIVDPSQLLSCSMCVTSTDMSHNIVTDIWWEQGRGREESNVHFTGEENDIQDD
jgi:hypothetical protein